MKLRKGIDLKVLSFEELRFRVKRKGSGLRYTLGWNSTAFFDSAVIFGKFFSHYKTPFTLYSTSSCVED